MANPLPHRLSFPSATTKFSSTGGRQWASIKPMLEVFLQPWFSHTLDEHSYCSVSCPFCNFTKGLCTIQLWHCFQYFFEIYFNCWKKSVLQFCLDIFLFPHFIFDYLFGNAFIVWLSLAWLVFQIWNVW